MRRVIGKVTVYHPLISKKITIGQLSVALSNEKLIGQIFDGTKYKVTYKPNMEDSLL